MRRVTRTSILAAVCVAALVGGYGAGAQESQKIPSGTAPAANVATEPVQSAVPAAAQAANDLEVELDEATGLPGPKRRTLMTGDRGPYRNTVPVEASLGLLAVVGFFRGGLSKAGWDGATSRAY